MHKYFFFFLIIIGSCQKEENKSNNNASIDEPQFNQLEISQQLDRDKIDMPLQFHHQLLAFVSDYQLLATASLPHRKEIAKTRAYYASLDHALWFHRDFSINDWLLYDMESPSASNSRGFARGSIFKEDGTMIASVAQEGLMRKLKK